MPAAPKPTPIADLARSLGHEFARPTLLAEAVTHPNVPASRHGRRGYQRLEWLGDRVLGLIVADLVWQRFPEEPEGHLTRRHSSLVRSEALARVAKTLDLGRYLILSPGEALAGISTKPAILADVCEAVIAAVYLDGGFSAAVDVVRRLWEPLLQEMVEPPHDAKARLQEWTQARGLGLPEYVLIETSGPGHALRFTMAAKITGYEQATATASSKQQAQEQAAALLLQTLAQHGPESIRRQSRKT